MPAIRTSARSRPRPWSRARRRLRAAVTGLDPGRCWRSARRRDPGREARRRCRSARPGPAVTRSSPRAMPAIRTPAVPVFRLRARPGAAAGAGGRAGSHRARVGAPDRGRGGDRRRTDLDRVGRGPAGWPGPGPDRGRDRGAVRADCRLGWRVSRPAAVGTAKRTASPTAESSPHLSPHLPAPRAPRGRRGRRARLAAVSRPVPSCPVLPSSETASIGAQWGRTTPAPNPAGNALFQGVFGWAPAAIPPPIPTLGDRSGRRQ